MIRFLKKFEVSRLHILDILQDTVDRKSIIFLRWLNHHHMTVLQKSQIIWYKCHSCSKHVACSKLWKVLLHFSFVWNQNLV